MPGTYTFNAQGLPLTSAGGTTSGDAAQSAIGGKWSAASVVSAAGTYTGTVHTTVGMIYEGETGLGPREDFFTVSASGGAWTASPANQALGNIAAFAQGGKPFQMRFDGSSWTSITITSFTFQLTGTPAPVPGVSSSPVARLFQVAPNLFFETPIYPPLELQPEAGPVEFPGIDWGPGASTDVFDGFGNLTPAAAKSIFGNDRVRGRKNVACLRRKGGAYINIGGAATQIVPAVMQVSLPGDAQWLKFTPGLANFAASASNGNVGIRVYAGLSQFALGKWTTGYTPIPVAPDWVGNGSFADLFPWERPLQFFVEITGLTTPIPAASLFEFRFDGFDLG